MLSYNVWMLCEGQGAPDKAIHHRFPITLNLMVLDEERMEELIEGVNAKACSQCGEIKHITLFTNKAGRYMGKRSECKVCEKEYRARTFEQRSLKSKERYESNKEEILESQRKYYLENKELIAVRNRQYSIANKEHLSSKQKEYYLKNKEEILSKQKQYYQDNREHRLEIVKCYASVNKDKIKDYLKEYSKLYNKNNRPKITAQTAKYRASKKNRTPGWLTEEDFSAIADFYILAKALNEATGESYHVDHIIPLQGELVSGLHVPSNLQILTAAENTAKNNSFDIEEFNNGNN